MQRQFQVEPLADDGHQHVDGDGGPDLGLDRVLRGAEETLDAKMLLDPLEKQLHLPAALVERAHGERGQRQMVGQKHQPLVSFEIAIHDAAQPLGIALMGIEHREFDQLIADQSGAAIHGLGEQALELGVRLGARHKEGASLVERIEPLEVEVAAIHHVEGAGLGCEQIEHVHVVELAVADMHEGRNRSSQIEQRVQFHRSLGGAKRRPGKQRQTQIDRSGVQRIDRLGEFHPDRLFGVEPACGADQRLRELVVDAPVALFVGIGERAAADVPPQAQMVQLGGLRAQTRFDVAQALPIGQLREGKTQVLGILPGKSGKDPATGASSSNR